MDIPKVTLFYSVIGELAFHLCKGSPKILEFPYQILLVSHSAVDHSSVVLASCCEFEDAVEEADELDRNYSLDHLSTNARITVVKVFYSNGLVVWDDLMPLVPVGL
tara:strand:+ start:133 stop:450 length:318 start_codon:yes stop_codon:yes gene_type:complete